MSNAVYIWDCLVALGVMVTDFGEAERTAYQIYADRKYGMIGNGRALQKWTDYLVKNLTKPEYADHFSEALISEAKRLQQQLRDKPQGALELDNLMQEGGGESLDRVIYEGIKLYNLGVYDPRYPLWSNLTNQLPTDSIERVLSSLPQISTDIQHINLSQLEVPRNTRAAVELMQTWFAEHPIGQNFSINIKKLENCNSYECFFEREVGENKQIFSVWIPELRHIDVSINFIIDFGAVVEQVKFSSK